MKLNDVLTHVGVTSTDDIPSSVEKTATRPWYVRTVLAITVWVGAALLAAFLMALNLLKHAPVQLFVGVAMFATSFFAARFMRGLGRLHVVLIGYVASTAALVVFFDRALHLRDQGALLATALLQLAFLFAVPSRVVRFKASTGAIMALWGFMLEDRVLGGVDALAVLLALTATTLWLFEAPLAASRFGPVARSLSFATPLALLFVLVTTVLGDREMRLQATPLLTGVFAAALVWIIVRAAKEADVARRSPVVVVAVVGVLAFAALTWRVPGVLGAAVVIALGRLRREAILEIAGSVGLAIFLFALYRSLELTLLAKAAAITGAGVVVLVLREVALRFTSPTQERAQPAAGTSILSPILARPSRLREIWRVAVPVVLVVGVTMGLVVKKEHVLAHGRIVFLELAPRDPRSLLQGDYMVLNYAAATELSRSGVQASGDARFSLDERGVARLDRKGDVELRYRVRDFNRVTFGAESFFFPEGQASAFSAARYGELRVDDDGHAVLVGLRDAELNAL